jgi:hypothetical protein
MIGTNPESSEVSAANAAYFLAVHKPTQRKGLDILIRQLRVSDNCHETLHAIKKLRINDERLRDALIDRLDEFDWESIEEEAKDNPNYYEQLQVYEHLEELLTKYFGSEQEVGEFAVDHLENMMDHELPYPNFLVWAEVALRNRQKDGIVKKALEKCSKPEANQRYIGERNEKCRALLDLHYHKD